LSLPVRHDITEILLKLALNTNQSKSLPVDGVDSQNSISPDIRMSTNHENEKKLTSYTKYNKA
jgi:hypothetical protein